MRISVFDGARDNDPKPLECAWDSLVQVLGPHKFDYAEKLSVPAFSPAEYPSGATRATKNVSGLWLFVADVDHVTQAVALATLSKVRDCRLAAVAYSTWSHAGDPWRFRIVNPLSRVVTPAEWPAFWSTMNAAYGGVCDPKCVDPARLYFGPYAPTGTETQNFHHIFEGDPVDVDAVLRSAQQAAPAGVLSLFAPQPLTKLSRDTLERYAKQLKKHSSDYLSAQGAALVNVCKGDPFAEPGDRDNSIFRLACLLGERFLDSDPQSVAVHFAPSLALMAQNSPDCPTVDDVAYKVERAQEEARSKQAEKVQAEEDFYAERVREAYKNGRSHPYTPEELASFGPNIGKRWIIQRDRGFYLFFNGSYKGPYTEAEVLNTAVRELAPARSAGVQLYTFSKMGGLVFKNIKQVVDEYGTVAESTVIDLYAQRTRYDEQERCIIEAACPLRPLTPTYHEDIDRWFQILCWSNPVYYENLKTWLAVVTRLDFICSALFLTGKKSVGKSLLALGIARLWSQHGPTSLEAAFGTFNDQLARCPFTFADEHLPKDFRGFTKFEELRTHIQEIERSYKRKYLSNSKLLSATRTLVAAHNKTILKTPQTLSDDEIEAIIERFFHIPTNPAAAEYLANLRPNTFERGWVSQDKIAEHILWLRDNHPHQSQGRFYVHVPDESLFRALSTQNGVKGALCQWLVSYLLAPTDFHKSVYSNLYVRVKHGRLLANARGIMSTWDTYVGKNEKCPPIGILSRALGELSTGERLKYEDKRGARTNYRVVEMKNLVSWVEDNDFADSEVLLATLARDTIEA